MEYLLGLSVILLIALLSRKKKYKLENELKKCDSPIEEIMMRALYKEGYYPYAQIPCRGYRIDVSLYYKGRKIAIECDGKAFHSSNKQLKHDGMKDKVLRKEKWIVLRFTGSEINRNIGKCIEEVNRYTRKKS